jgi:hypothetical protein
MSEYKGQQKGCIGTIITCGAISSALAGILALLAYFGLKPPIIVPEPLPTPAHMKGELSDVTIEYDISFEEHMNRLGWSLANYTEEQKLLVGAIVRVDEEIVGFKDQPCTIKWTVYDTTLNKLVISSTPDFEILVTPESETDKANISVWVGYPQKDGIYFARIELYDPDNVRLDSIDTEEFSLTIK